MTWENILAHAIQTCPKYEPYGGTSVRFIINDKLYEAEANYSPVCKEGKPTGDHRLELKVKHLP